MKTVLLSLHDVTPAFAAEVREVCAGLDALGACRRSLLVVPDFLSRTPIGDYPEWCQEMAALRPSGTDLGLHGMRHRYAECGFLSYGKAMAELGESKRRFEDAFGFAPTGFVAPQWFQSSGCKKALCDLGFVYSGRWLGLCGREGRFLHHAMPYNFDWGNPLMDGLMARSNARRLSRLNDGVIRLSLHPMDVRHGFLKLELELIEGLMKRGFSIRSYNDAARGEL